MSRGHHGHGLDDRLTLVVLVPGESTAGAADRVAEEPRTGGDRRSGRREHDGRRGLVSAVRRCRPVQELNVLVELRVIGHRGGGAGDGVLDAAAYERIDQERPGHGPLGGGGGHGDGRTARAVHAAGNKRISKPCRRVGSTFARVHEGDQR